MKKNSVKKFEVLPILFVTGIGIHFGHQEFQIPIVHHAYLASPEIRVGSSQIMDMQSHEMFTNKRGDGVSCIMLAKTCMIGLEMTFSFFLSLFFWYSP